MMHIIALRRRKRIITEPVGCMRFLALDHLLVVSLVRYAMSGRRGGLLRHRSLRLIICYNRAVVCDGNLELRTRDLGTIHIRYNR